jgi:hypothetical protein
MVHVSYARRRVDARANRELEGFVVRRDEAVKSYLRVLCAGDAAGSEQRRDVQLDFYGWERQLRADFISK